MIKIEYTQTYAWEAAVRGMRNPMDSHKKSDSTFALIETEEGKYIPDIGKNDLDLMKRLVKAGSDHSKFMRMLIVTCDITAPLYWWKEYDTYKVGTVANSCSTMHKIHSKEFALSDFSHEHMSEISKNIMGVVIRGLNSNRKEYNEGKDKDHWWQMIQLLPTSYNQKRTVMLNYAVLRNMYHARKFHKLDEWVAFCRWVETLPYSELITMRGETI